MSDIYGANQHISPSSPTDSDFQLDYRDVWIVVPKSIARMHGWWFDAPDVIQPVIAISITIWQG